MFFIGFITGALMGTACIYYALLKPPPPAEDDWRELPPPRVRTTLTNRERKIEL